MEISGVHEKILKDTIIYDEGELLDKTPIYHLLLLEQKSI